MIRLQDYLAFEIKKEIAHRYFGFRKLIEEDKLDLEAKLSQHSFILEKRISFELLRTFMLLKKEKLIFEFLAVAGLDKGVFYDPQFTRLDALKGRLFNSITPRGLTARWKFSNLLLSSYDRLSIHVLQYRDKIAELMELKKNIDEEIKLFHRQNDLGSILGFLKALGNPSRVAGLEGGLEIGLADALAEKMKIDPPLPIEHYLPVIESLPPLGAARKTLKKLARQAFALHGKIFLADYPERATSSRPDLAGHGRQTTKP